ncbi:MarR family transcriptional regulator [Corynebacterium suranareeae]|uniref:MarR family transcriptional regulator n=1 Tax=Corynebacterium suranareeae TaxID=2506452 RepID=A0A160PPM1_9CORY|nr:MarR family winged helix-turn-helix transcriptional regulator [Corynebacterium suranareeae]BAU95446.1 MarR family transcriptional regulator [Corynebacterium suranareeae]
MSTDPAELENADILDQLAYEIILLTRYGVQNTPTLKRETIMDRSALILLSRLDVQGPMTVNELAESFALNVSTVHRQLKAAIANGLIEVVDDPDCPAKLHRPTQLGKEKLELELHARQQDLVRILHDWDAEDIKIHTQLLRKHNESLEDYLDLKWPRPKR